MKAGENALFMLAITIMICAVLCQAFQLKPVVVISGSMEPAIKTGSLAFIDKKSAEVKEGDVITFRKGGVLVTHRIIEDTGTGYVTKGDNNDDADYGVVEEEQIEGKILFSIPGLGFFLKTIVLPAGTASILLYIIMKCINRGKRDD